MSRFGTFIRRPPYLLRWNEEAEEIGSCVHRDWQCWCLEPSRSQALRAPGVRLVMTGKDIAAHEIGPLPPLFMPEDAGGPKGFRTMRPILVDDVVRHVGDRVAFCVADTLDQARDGAELIAIDYEPLPGVIDVTFAADPSASKVSSTFAFGGKPVRFHRSITVRPRLGPGTKSTVTGHSRMVNSSGRSSQATVQGSCSANPRPPKRCERGRSA